MNIEEYLIEVDLSSLIVSSAVNRVNRPINSGYSTSGVLGTNKTRMPITISETAIK
jgi:hypothetical protein